MVSFSHQAVSVVVVVTVVGYCIRRMCNVSCCFSVCPFILSRRSIILLLVFPLMSAAHQSNESPFQDGFSSETSYNETLTQRHHRLRKRQLDGASLPIIELNYRIKEETNSGTFVGNVKKDSNIERLYDSKTSLALRFRFLKPRSQVQTSLFSLNSTTGLMKTRSRIDRESVCLPGSAVCTVKVDVAVQPVEFFRIIRVTVEVEDINDHPPSFPQPILKFEVFETVSPNKTGLVLPPASDPDSPPYAVQVVYHNLC